MSTTMLRRAGNAYIRNSEQISKIILILMSIQFINQTRITISGAKPRKPRAEIVKRTEGDVDDPEKKAEVEQAVKNEAAKRKKKEKESVDVDAVFIARLKRIIKIVFPSFWSKETLLLGMHTALLIFRTILSVYVARLDGAIVSALVRKKGRLFLQRIALWCCIAVPATYTNSLLGYMQNTLSLVFRTRLTRVVHKQYMKGTTFYALGNLDDRIVNADQLITVDIYKFSKSIAAVYSNIAKPMLDVMVYNYQLTRSVGANAQLGMTILVQLSTVLLRVLTPSFGKYTADEQRLEGEYRFGHTRLIENAEEVAFFRGSITEKNIIERSFYKLKNHIERVFYLRMWYAIVEEAIVKWFWGSLGLIVCAVPVFIKPKGPAPIPGPTGDSGDGSDYGSRTESFVTNRRLLLSSSDAMGRLLSTYRELSELSGFTLRVTQLLDAMSDVSEGKYSKKLVSSSDSTEENAKKLQGRGKLIFSKDNIVFDRVPILTPNGDVLIPELSFFVNPGQHLLVVGGNGTGKSSLFRILGGLWPIYGGTVTKPPASEFTYIPQRPYLSLGSFRDQVIYPDAHQDMIDRGITDHDLQEILELLEIGHIPAREGGWDVVREWRDALSGGDKQRIAMARLFYHKPKFAILDESTSAVTFEIEKIFYDRATELGITLLTVSHRPSLWKYHKYILQYDGQGGYAFGPLDADKRLALMNRKQELEQKLLKVPDLEERLKEMLAEAELRKARKALREKPN